MLNYFKKIIDYLSFDFSAYSYIIVLALVIAFFVISIVEVLKTAISKKSCIVGYYGFYLFVNFLLVSYFSFEDYLRKNSLFLTFKNVYAFLTAILLLSTLFLLIVYAISSNKKVNALNLVAVKGENLDNEIVNKKVLTQSGELFTGYLDVNYVKSLVNKLKEKPLSDEDYLAVEDFEVYLLNFVSRQPNDNERKVLSEYLSMLIKKLAKYEV